MSLSIVSYDLSDSEDGSSDEATTGTDSKPKSLFSSLPKPKSMVVIPERESPTPSAEVTKKTREPVKISVPALVNYDSDEEQPVKKIRKVNTKAAGLFSLLPEPKVKTSFTSNTNADLMSKKNLIPKAAKQIKPPKPAIVEIDDEEEPDIGSNFFSSIFTETRETNPSPLSNIFNMTVDSAKAVDDAQLKTNQYFANLVASQNEKKIEAVAPPEEEEDVNEIIERNVPGAFGKDRKRQKGNVQLIEVNADDQTSSDWRTKVLTQEQPATVKKGEEPSLQSKRKHQITYLAYQAKLNEQELQNQWASNRVTRKQTQAKYGF